MFNSIDKTYFGDRIVKGIEETGERIIVTFADDQKPQTEEMDKSEWEGGKSDKPMDNPSKKQEWFVKRTSGMRQKLVDLAVSFNPRFTDLKKMIAWIDEGVNMTYKNVVSRVFGLDSFDNEATVELVCKRLEDSGQVVTSEKWTEFQKDILKLIREKGVKVHEITSQAFFGDLQSKIEEIISESVALALGGSDEARRCDDIEKLIQSYAKDRSPDGSEGMGSSFEPTANAIVQSEDEGRSEGEGDKGGS